MSLFDVKNNFISVTKVLPKSYTEYTITELADKYCEAKDKNNKKDIDIYISALMLRFWYRIDEMYQKSKSSGYDREDCYYKLYECIEAAMKYRAWQDPTKKTNAQACINQVIASRGVPALIYDANLQKNFRANISLDDSLKDDSKNTLGDLVEDGSYAERESDDFVDDAVQKLLQENKVIEAIIADTIAYNDVFKKEETTVKETNADGTIKKYKKVSSSLWTFKVVQELNQIDNEYLRYFADRYIIKDTILVSAFNTLNKANNQKKYKYIDKTLSNLKAIFSN